MCNKPNVSYKLCATPVKKTGEGEKRKLRKTRELPHCMALQTKISSLISSPLASDLCAVASGTARQCVSRSKKEFWGPPLGLESWTSWLSVTSPQSASGGSSEWICTQKVKGWSPSSVAEQLTRSSQDCLSGKTTLDTREEDDSWELKVLSGEEIEQDASLDRVEVKEDFCWSCFPETNRGGEKKKIFPRYSCS